MVSVDRRNPDLIQPTGHFTASRTRGAHFQWNDTCSRVDDAINRRRQINSLAIKKNPRGAQISFARIRDQEMVPLPVR